MEAIVRHLLPSSRLGNYGNYALVVSGVNSQSCLVSQGFLATPGKTFSLLSPNQSEIDSLESGANPLASYLTTYAPSQVLAN